MRQHKGTPEGPGICWPVMCEDVPHESRRGGERCPAQRSLQLLLGLSSCVDGLLSRLYKFKDHTVLKHRYL